MHLDVWVRTSKEMKIEDARGRRERRKRQLPNAHQVYEMLF
jgi:hypothetical protein